MPIKKPENSTDSAFVRRQRDKVFHTVQCTGKEEKMHTTSKSLKVTAGALAIALAILGLTACGSRGGSGGTTPQMMAPGAPSGSSSAQFEAGNTVN